MNFQFFYPKYEFPYKWDKNGRCEKLSDDNMCTVYDQRPSICNIDHMIMFFDIDKEKGYEDCANACNNLMDQAGIDLSKRVSLVKNVDNDQ